MQRQKPPLYRSQRRAQNISVVSDFRKGAASVAADEMAVKKKAVNRKVADTNFLEKKIGF